MYVGPSAAVSKLQILQRILHSGSRFNGPTAVRVFLHSNSDGKRVSIGDVSRAIKEPLNPELVPHGYLNRNLSQWELRHLRWLMQKDNMGQDVFLMGGPGPLRRRLALAYLELTRREAEYVTLTRDTTEADLKQRREIKDATSYYHDQAAVRAATQGRVLVLDGIEKAERNVLPVLNNLLENREMNLDDGRRLVPHDRYDALVQEHGSQVKDLNVLRVSADFRVVALGLPCPPHQGQPLDPPLRSRFQAREISYPPFQDELQQLQGRYPAVSRDVITRCLSVGHALMAQESKALALPDYPLPLLHTVLAVLNKFPSLPPESVLPLAYPHAVCLPSEAQEPLNDLLNTFDLNPPQQDTASGYILDAVQSVRAAAPGPTLHLDMTVNGEDASVEVMGGSLGLVSPASEDNVGSSFTPTPHHSSVLSSVLQLHAVGSDVCLVGPRGCGKSAVVAEAARLLGYRVEPVLLYQDMTARDLMQQRATDDSGNTVWRLSSLLQAALQGSMAVLDGLHRLHSNTLAALHRLVQDREVQLYDGTRLLHHTKYDAVQSELGITADEMTSQGLLRINPAFRIVALAEPPQLSDVQGQWMKPEALALMPWRVMREPSREEMVDLVMKLVQPQDSATIEQVHQLCSLSAALSTSSGNVASLGQSLSLRQVLRIARRLHQYPGHLSLYELVQDACLARFLPILVKQSLDETMEAVGIYPPKQPPPSQHEPSLLECTIEGDQVTIGSTTAQRYRPQSTSKVPKTLFFDIEQHVAVLERLLQDWQLGEHLLLIGNQGVGKNKLADRFLELINRPREYLQLHRDSTVQSLTVQPCVKDGLLSHQDSPLVTAVKEGSVLLLDEADKAPTHVTCVLKTLVESGEMLLSDGRRIVPATHPLAQQPNDPQVIVSHPHFRMIVLANRPGFPFLGNDFFAVLGDLFSCHGIHNPAPASELALLASYGPDVPRPLLARLVAGFGALRDLADSGTLQYPYSTREVVAVVKHLQHYPKDGVSLAVRNVLDFDSWSADARTTVVKTLHQHGLPIDTSDATTSLATKISLGEPEYLGRWRINNDSVRPVGVSTERISYKGPTYIPAKTTSLSAREARAHIFTELHSYYQLPLPDSALITDLITSSQKPTGSFNDSDPPKSRMTDTMAILHEPANVDPGPEKAKSDVSATVKALRDPFGTSKLQATVHVATVAPLALHTLMPSDSLTRPLTTLSLHSVLPNLGGSHQPRLRLWKGVGDMVGLYEELTNTVLLADPHNGEVLQLNKHSFLERIKLPLRQLTQQQLSNACSASGDALFIYSPGQDSATVVDPKNGMINTLQLPMIVASVTADGRGGWIVKDDQGSNWLIGGENGLDSAIPFELERNVEFKKFAPVNNLVVTNALNFDSNADNAVFADGRAVQKDGGMLFTSDKAQAALLPGFPHDESGSLYAWARKENPHKKQHQTLTQFDSIGYTRSISPVLDAGRNCVVLPSSGQVVQTRDKLPDSAPDVLKSVPASGYLEVTDVADRVVSYLPVPRLEEYSEYWEWTVGRLAPKLMLAGDEHGGVVSVDKVGGLRVWQVGGQELQAGIAEWESMVGEGETGRLELERSGGDMSLSAPKHGKLDAKNAPHVGGNTWAGGTGGRDTAGLGGVGGPYRLDAGHDVHQVSDEVKASVPPEITEAARKMAKAAHAKRLKEIQMSEYDHEQYEAVSSNVRAQVTQMRAVLSSLTAKAGERWWVRRRPDGELDDSALVDGLAGATNIYRQRREIPPEAGQPQTKPKRLRLLLDASGSMYRFNGHDQRLQRSLEAALMLMEACQGHESRLVFDIYAHSGEDHSVPLSRLKSPPDNNKKRLDLLRTVLAHSQFCMSGDSTVMATKNAVDKLAQTADDYDQNFVVLLSDANLDRYGISPARFAAAMTAQSNVQCYVVFIGSLGNQAKKLATALPAGRAYLCMDTHDLPQILQHIFTHAMTQ